MAIAKRIAAVTLGVSALLASAPAFALSSTTAGSDAWTSNTSTTTNGRANVKDTSADSRSAYGEYERRTDPGTVKTLWNKSGSGTTVSSDGGTIYKIRACRQEQWASNTCGAWAA
ncbi:hypothetical protein [Streptomyces hydrogenans]|uniref:Secreted protein n=1 Tax=Streptomyces hydrogenans TaxID=1873719 RepID=A0ABQ3PNL2_9ACTN|nr:hypothetical protein [Streptomyces hydrogenans]GHG41176.1 hypothetical protein GCM10018784_63650 [Streptomyces hydrogenans]GHI26608.1 hypothetical protein Shyd_79790 [Streptomyces hydrogenans]